MLLIKHGVRCLVCSLCVHFSLLTLYTLHTHFIHTLHTHFIHNLYTHFIHNLYTLYTHTLYTHFIHTLYTHTLYTIYTIHYIHTIHTLYTLDTHSNTNISSDLINIFDVFLPQLLLYPNPKDPLNREAAAMLIRDEKKYKERVLGWFLLLCYVK
jgi:hypothetical protein